MVDGTQEQEIDNWDYGRDTIDHELHRIAKGQFQHQGIDLEDEHLTSESGIGTSTRTGTRKKDPPEEDYDIG